MSFFLDLHFSMITVLFIREQKVKPINIHVNKQPYLMQLPYKRILLNFVLRIFTVVINWKFVDTWQKMFIHKFFRLIKRKLKVGIYKNMLYSQNRRPMQTIKNKYLEFFIKKRNCYIMYEISLFFIYLDYSLFLFHWKSKMKTFRQYLK